MSPVRATVTGTWPGHDAHQAAAATVQELGAPHLPVIPELPARGPGTDPVGRTAIMLDELAVDLQPHGWRLTDTPGVDARRGATAWRADLNRVADAAGETGTDLEEIVLRVLGPLSLAARLWLPGENEPCPTPAPAGTWPTRWPPVWPSRSVWSSPSRVLTG